MYLSLIMTVMRLQQKMAKRVSFIEKKNTSGGSSTPSTPTSYKLRVGGVEVTSANTSGTGWSYDNQTNTLTLDGFNYEGNGSGIETSKDLNIIIKNENRIKNISSSYSDSTNGWSCGIYAFGNLTITGDGTLDVTGGTADTSHGISVLGKLEIDSQGTIMPKHRQQQVQVAYMHMMVLLLKMVILQHMLQKQLTVAVVLNVMAI